VSDGEYVRWVNSKEPGALMFVTTTILGYTPALMNPSEKEFLPRLLASDCRHFGAVLHAYCVMDHHLHMVIRAPLSMTMSEYMQRFKRRSAIELLKRAIPYTKRCLLRASKDNRSFWMRSFRGIPIRSARVMWGTIRYVHLNPVRAGLCERTNDYPWSSALLFEECKWTEEQGVLPWLE
jgi:putative transposase